MPVRDGRYSPITNLSVWEIDYAASYIRFIGDQAGAEFEGVWETWSAELQFSADNPGDSAFNVRIDTASGNTRDTDRDTTLRDPEWFDTTNFPEAFYKTSSIELSPDGDFVADGQLIIKDTAAPVQFSFSVEEAGSSRILTGTSQLNRLDHNVGTGEWEDTEWVGAEVQVIVRIEAALPQK